MDLNPYLHTVSIFGIQYTPEASNNPEDTPAERRERRNYWLNTSKDPVVGNEQRIAGYFAASPKIAATEHREASNCKQRWHKINDLVNKFYGAYEAATREKSSGQKENDVPKLTHEIFFNNHKKKKIILEHAWKELQNDQKWCDLATSKNESSCKRRTCEDGSQSESSHANETKTEEDRPPGVKAAKGKKPKIEEKEMMAEFQSMWTIKQQDLAMKEKLSKMSLLDSLLAKKEPLTEYKEALKKKAHK
ncbi:hypothetical protein N665_0010s0009 [Sinapis alba]|nr:hypothetical protein N665_0010s0009 [Sinapis alba]